MVDLAASNIAWAAGLIEGEGCFTIHSGHPYFLIDMCDKDVLEKFQKIFPNSTFRGPYIDVKNPQYKPRYRVDAFGPKCVEIMEAIYPYMGLRRQLKIEELRKLNNNNRL